jgi:pyridoxamine 5'-phosphate oxidase
VVPGGRDSRPADARGSRARDVLARRRAVGAHGARQELRRAQLCVLLQHASRKGRELAANPRAALLFYWDPLGRQVRVEGPVERTSAEETAAYVCSRPRGSQLSALASPQSQPVDSRAALERGVAELEQRYGERELPLSSDWGGYRLSAERVEFWQQRHDRLHDRLLYRREPPAGWLIERLAP